MDFNEKINAFKAKIKQDKHDIGSNVPVSTYSYSDYADIEVNYKRLYRIYKATEKIVALGTSGSVKKVYKVIPSDLGTLDTTDQYNWSGNNPVKLDRKQVPSSNIVKDKIKAGLSTISKDDWSARDYKGDNPTN